MPFLTPVQHDAIAGIARLEAMLDEALESADGDVLALRAEVRRLGRDLDRAIDRVGHWMQEARQWRDGYIAMRRERNEAMDQWVNFMERQFAGEVHLETQAMLARDRAARELLEIIELWCLKNQVEAEDLGEAEGSDS